MTRHRQATDRDREWARRYEAGENCATIARGVPCSPETVRKGIMLAGFAVRARGPVPVRPPALRVDWRVIGSLRLARALWAYGAKHSGLPNMTRERCKRLVGE